MTLSSLMRHVNVGDRPKPTPGWPTPPSAEEPSVHVHEIATLTRTYTSEYMRNMQEWTIDVAHFNEFTSTWCWFLWNKRTSKGDLQKFLEWNARHWGSFRAMGKSDHRECKKVPGIAQQNDSFVADKRVMLGEGAKIGGSVHECLAMDDLVPKAT